MDELLISVPVRIPFPLQSTGLRTLDHFVGNHFFCNYVTFDFLMPLKLPVSHVAERRFNRLRETPPLAPPGRPSIIYTMKRLCSLCTGMFTF